MEQITITKRSSYSKDSVSVRIAKDVNEQLDVLSEKTGYTKTAIADLLLRKALEVTIVAESEL